MIKAACVIIWQPSTTLINTFKNCNYISLFFKFEFFIVYYKKCMASFSQFQILFHIKQLVFHLSILSVPAMNGMNTQRTILKYDSSCIIVPYKIVYSRGISSLSGLLNSILGFKFMNKININIL